MPRVVKNLFNVGVASSKKEPTWLTKIHSTVLDSLTLC